MKLPRDLSGETLARRLERLGYRVTRQTGSHLRLSLENGEHHLTIPARQPLRVGTLAAILAEVARHHGLSRDQVVEHLLG